MSQKASHEHVSNHCASGGCRAYATSACCCRDADFISISADVVPTSGCLLGYSERLFPQKYSQKETTEIYSDITIYLTNTQANGRGSEFLDRYSMALFAELA